MKKQLTLFSIAALGALAMTAGPINAKAEVVKEAGSEATITAVAGEETVIPVNPDKPDEPGNNNPEDGTETGQTGPLQINFVSHLNFGTDIKITSKNVTANAKNTKTPYFQVSDLRGNGEGWSLKVSLGEFKAAGSEKTIPGATVAFNNGVAVTSNETNDNPATTSDLVLDVAGTSKPMLTATKGNGRGTWLAAYPKTAGAVDNDKIVFNAPTNSIDANTDYTSVLTWQLTDTPDPTN